MHTPIRWAGTRAAFAAAASFAFGLAGCGGGGGSTSSDISAPSSTPTQTATLPDTSPDPTSASPTAPTSQTPTTASTSTATLQWSAPQTMTDGSAVSGIVGYRVYYGTDVAKMTTKVDIMNPSVSTFVVEGLAPGTYYFAVSALHSSGGESDRSNAGVKIIS